MSEGKQFMADEARRTGIDWAEVDVEQFREGLAVEIEHGSYDPKTDVTHDDPLLTGKIVRSDPIQGVGDTAAPPMDKEASEADDTAGPSSPFLDQFPMPR